jgi:hypothetical protein
MKMASKKMDKLKEAGAGMDKFFSGASESPSEAEKKTTKGNTKAKAEEGSEKPQKAQKKVFSFRAEVDHVDSWRVWADAKGIKVDELGEKAITEYIKRHSLTEDQKQIYDLKMAQKKL